MEYPVESWYSAIFQRRSRRVFVLEQPEEEKLARLEMVCRDFRPFPQAKAELIRTPPEDVFRGVIGSYGKIKNSPLYLAFIGSCESPHFQEAVGYTGEGLILEATALGLATCWVGGYFRPQVVSRHLDLEPHQRVLAISPVGYAERKWTFQDRVFSGFGLNHRRRSMKDLVSSISLLPWMEQALEATRLAPSAVNRQPWRFSRAGDSLVISVDDAKETYRISKRLDCGIAMLHLEIGALRQGIRGKWSSLAPPEVARFDVISN